MNKTLHTPVLLQETLTTLQLTNNDNVVDATIGGGTMAKAILDITKPNGKLLALDKDSEALKRSAKMLSDYKNRIIYEKADFRNIDSVIKNRFPYQVKAIYADFGVSSDQLADRKRGISFQFPDAPLDMRMDIETKGMTAKELLNSGRKEDIADILYHYGGEKKARILASKIIETRRTKPFETVEDLLKVVEEVIPKRGKIHPATRTMQALRIAVNDEIEAITEFVTKAFNILPSNGILAVITFHSLEDRAVKNNFKKFIKSKHATSRVKKFLKPTRAEILTNPRSRSAKLRAIQKTK